MTENLVLAETRENFGKGFARRLRAAGKIPAVVYGHGEAPRHLALPGHQLSLIVRQANALLDLDIDGTRVLALVKDVQRDPVRQIIEHIDLLIVRKGEKVEVEVPVHVVGEPFSGNMATLETTTIRLLVEATHVPENVQVSVEGLEDGAHVSAGQVDLPQGASLVDDPELILVVVAQPAAAHAAELEDEAAAE